VSTSGPGLGPPRLPGYRFLQQLGAGGNSQVYLYEQDMPRRKVAVKVLNDAGLTAAVRAQFTAEADAMAGLADHPHIVQVFTADVAADGRPYLVMQYYPRPNLAVRARREHFCVADVLRIGIQIGSAVETSHRSGILHRDIKPHNILTGQYGTPGLTDFGIAARKGAAGPEGMSVPWSPPEILFGTSPGDERADVYSLGATLWHLLAGRSPFEQPGGDNATLTLMRRIQSEPPPRLPRADVPASLERLLRQAMAKDPAARPQTAVGLLAGLQAVERELRLPHTEAVLPDGEPQAGRPADVDGEVTLIRDAGRAGPRPPAWPHSAERAAPSVPGPPVRHQPGAADATRARAAARIDPWGPAAPAPPERRRQLPPEAPEAATGIRPATVWPTGPAAAPGPDAGPGPGAGRPRPPHRGRGRRHRRPRGGRRRDRAPRAPRRPGPRRPGPRRPGPGGKLGQHPERHRRQRRRPGHAGRGRRPGQQRRRPVPVDLRQPPVRGLLPLAAGHRRLRPGVRRHSQAGPRPRRGPGAERLHHRRGGPRRRRGLRRIPARLRIVTARTERARRLPPQT
jgi:hypothetical protein